MDSLDVSTATNWLTTSAVLLADHASELNDLDSAIGDGDHGTNMRRGFAAVAEVVGSVSFDTLDALLKKVGTTLVSTVGGASGPLYGTFFMRMGTSLKDQSSADHDAWGTALRAGMAGIEQRGKSTTGEKTMLDAWAPALDAFDAHSDVTEAIAAAAAAADSGRAATKDLVATKGRASYLGERSVGHVDPGATSTALLWQALTEAVQ